MAPEWCHKLPQATATGGRHRRHTLFGTIVGTFSVKDETTNLRRTLTVHLTQPTTHGGGAKSGVTPAKKTKSMRKSMPARQGTGGNANSHTSSYKDNITALDSTQGYGKSKGKKRSMPASTGNVKLKAAVAAIRVLCGTKSLDKENRLRKPLLQRYDKTYLNVNQSRAVDFEYFHPLQYTVPFAVYLRRRYDPYLKAPFDHPAYQAKKLFLRESLYFHPRIRAVLNAIMNLSDIDGDRNVSYSEYKILHSKMCLATSGSEYHAKSAAEKTMMCDTDWKADSKGAPFLGYHEFTFSWFQLADSFTEEISFHAYYKFLITLINRMARVNSKGHLVWRDPDSIIKKITTGPEPCDWLPATRGHPEDIIDNSKLTDASHAHSDNVGVHSGNVHECTDKAQIIHVEDGFGTLGDALKHSHIHQHLAVSQPPAVTVADTNTSHNEKSNRSMHTNEVHLSTDDLAIHEALTTERREEAVEGQNININEYSVDISAQKREKSHDLVEVRESIAVQVAKNLDEIQKTKVHACAKELENSNNVVENVSENVVDRVAESLDDTQDPEIHASTVADPSHTHVNIIATAGNEEVNTTNVSKYHVQGTPVEHERSVANNNTDTRTDSIVNNVDISAGTDVIVTDDTVINEETAIEKDVSRPDPYISIVDNGTENTETTEEQPETNRKNIENSLEYETSRIENNTGLEESNHLERSLTEGSHIETSHTENSHIENSHIENSHIENIHIESSPTSNNHLGPWASSEEQHGDTPGESSADPEKVPRKNGARNVNGKLLVNMKTVYLEDMDLPEGMLNDPRGSPGSHTGYDDLNVTFKPFDTFTLPAGAVHADGDTEGTPSPALLQPETSIDLGSCDKLNTPPRSSKNQESSSPSPSRGHASANRNRASTSPSRPRSRLHTPAHINPKRPATVSENSVKSREHQVSLGMEGTYNVHTYTCSTDVHEHSARDVSICNDGVPTYTYTKKLPKLYTISKAESVFGAECSAPNNIGIEPHSGDDMYAQYIGSFCDLGGEKCGEWHTSVESTRSRGKVAPFYYDKKKVGRESSDFVVGTPHVLAAAQWPVPIDIQREESANVQQYRPLMSPGCVKRNKIQEALDWQEKHKEHI